MFRRLRWPKMSIRPYDRFSQIRHGRSWRSLKDRACEPAERGEGYASRAGLNVATGDGLLQGLHLHANRRHQRDVTFERPGASALRQPGPRRTRMGRTPQSVGEVRRRTVSRLAITTGPTSVV